MQTQQVACKVNPNCLIQCDIENLTFTLPHKDARVSRLIKAQYKDCRRLQKEQTLNIFEKKSQARRTTCTEVDDPQFLALFQQAEREKLRANVKTQLQTNGTVVFSKILGQGLYGVVMEVCGSIPQDFRKHIVVKATRDGSSLRSEYRKQLYFAKVGLAPKPEDPFSSNLSFFVMGKIDGTVGNLLRHERLDSELNEIISQSVQLLFRMCDHNMVHGDLHFQNIAYIINPKNKRKVFLCLDFSEATAGCEPEIDLLQLIRDTYTREYHLYNAKYLRKHLQHIYNTNYEEPLSNETFKQMSDRRLRLIYEHRRRLETETEKLGPTPAQKKVNKLRFQEVIESEDDYSVDEYDDEGDNEGDDEGVDTDADTEVLDD